MVFMRFCFFLDFKFYWHFSSFCSGCSFVRLLITLVFSCDFSLISSAIFRFLHESSHHFTRLLRKIGSFLEFLDKICKIFQSFEYFLRCKVDFNDFFLFARLHLQNTPKDRNYKLYDCLIFKPGRLSITSEVITGVRQNAPKHVALFLP